jgi:hypothetical protein
MCLSKFKQHLIHIVTITKYAEDDIILFFCYWTIHFLID